MTTNPTISIGGREYEVAELTIKRMRQTAKLGIRVVDLQRQDVTAENLDAMFDVVIDLVMCWVGDGHPELTREFIDDHMTKSEMEAVTEQIHPVLQAAGVKAPPAGEGGGEPAAPEKAAA